MKILSVLILSMFMFSVTGCKLTEVKGEVNGVEVSAKEKGSKDDDKESSGFCPPGQAKKGNC